LLQLQKNMILPRSFYTRADVVRIAMDLLGKYLVTRTAGVITSGLICETEAYAGTTDRASHAFGGRRSTRTQIMYGEGGIAYIYLCYGIHSLFNVVTNEKEIPHAVLIRAIIPADGIGTMLSRAGKTAKTKNPGIGPGNVSKLLGIHHSQTGSDLTVKPDKSQSSGIWIEDRGYPVTPSSVITGPRIGVEYAGEDAQLPYRFRFSHQTPSIPEIKTGRA
jgi:DNA-3-methyladenine glycosylase